MLSVGRGALFQEPGRMRTCGGALLCMALLASLCLAQSRELKQSLNDVRARHYLARWAHDGVASMFGRLQAAGTGLTSVAGAEKCLL